MRWQGSVIAARVESQAEPPELEAVDDDPYAGYAAYAVNLPQPDESE